jgi:hypothetical protein
MSPGLVGSRVQVSISQTRTRGHKFRPVFAPTGFDIREYADILYPLLFLDPGARKHTNLNSEPCI